MDLPARRRYRSIGAQLARYIRERNGELPSHGVLQAVVADIAAAEADLVLPLKALVAKPSFRGLAQLAGTGGGALQRDALLEDLKATFSLEICEKLSDFINGFLDLKHAESTKNVAYAAEAPLHQQCYDKQIVSKVESSLGRVDSGGRLPIKGFLPILLPLLLSLAAVSVYLFKLKGSCLLGSCYLGQSSSMHAPIATSQKGQPVTAAQGQDRQSNIKQERKSGDLIGVCKSGKELYSLGFVDNPNAGLIETASGDYVRPNIQRFNYGGLVFTLSETYRGGDFSVYGDTAGYANNSISISFSNRVLGFGVSKFGKLVDECAYLDG